ncbi:hypothetical protein GCM10009092_41460 [Bowmanella denitrificans]|uniref:Uncharacterized protein n=1 Tax=Bowmanella denitrificans TaxID=366582 RepID=A0ABN0XU60_9ALTE
MAILLSIMQQRVYLAGNNAQQLRALRDVLVSRQLPINFFHALSNQDVGGTRLQVDDILAERLCLSINQSLLESADWLVFMLSGPNDAQQMAGDIVRAMAKGKRVILVHRKEQSELFHYLDQTALFVAKDHFQLLEYLERQTTGAVS